jgi:hypothetical protein
MGCWHGNVKGSQQAGRPGRQVGGSGASAVRAQHDSWQQLAAAHQWRRHVAGISGVMPQRMPGETGERPPASAVVGGHRGKTGQWGKVKFASQSIFDEMNLMPKQANVCANGKDAYACWCALPTAAHRHSAAARHALPGSRHLPTAAPLTLGLMGGVSL